MFRKNKQTARKSAPSSTPNPDPVPETQNNLQTPSTDSNQVPAEIIDQIINSPEQTSEPNSNLSNNLNFTSLIRRNAPSNIAPSRSFFQTMNLQRRSPPHSPKRSPPHSPPTFLGRIRARPTQNRNVFSIEPTEHQEILGVPRMIQNNFPPANPQPEIPQTEQENRIANGINDDFALALQGFLLQLAQFTNQIAGSRERRHDVISSFVRNDVPLNQIGLNFLSDMATFATRFYCDICYETRATGFDKRVCIGCKKTVCSPCYINLREQPPHQASSCPFCKRTGNPLKNVNTHRYNTVLDGRNAINRTRLSILNFVGPIRDVPEINLDRMRMRVRQLPVLINNEPFYSFQYPPQIPAIIVGNLIPEYLVSTRFQLPGYGMVPQWLLSLLSNSAWQRAVYGVIQVEEFATAEPFARSYPGHELSPIIGGNTGALVARNSGTCCICNLAIIENGLCCTSEAYHTYHFRCAADYFLRKIYEIVRSGTRMNRVRTGDGTVWEHEFYFCFIENCEGFLI